MFQIRWTRKALFSFADTLNYWNFHNSSQKYSRKLRIEVEKKEKLISKNPHIGTLSEIEGIRYILIDKNFSIYYRAVENTVEILAFWDNRRNPDTLEI